MQSASDGWLHEANNTNNNWLIDRFTAHPHKEATRAKKY